MTGIERLRELAQNCRTASVNGYTTVIANVHAAAVEAIADQIEREGEEYDRRQSKRWTIVWWMVREMEQHVSGVEGMEDSPVAHWARELRYALKSDTSDECDAQNPSCADPAEAASVTSDAAKVTRDPAEDVSMSAYDLLPADEREAIAWVREHGGLSDVRLCHNAADNRRAELCSALDIDRETGWSDAMAAMRPRLMPEGMEWLVEAWPRFEDDAPIRFGDEFIDHQGGVRSVLHVKMWQEGGFELGTGQGTYDWHEYGERVKRPTPKVTDADGVEIRVGDTVWTIKDARELEVTGLYPEQDSCPVKVKEHKKGAYIFSGIDPDQLTHRAPVLAADGKPLREGETAYHVADGRACVVREVREGGAVVEPVDGRPCGRCRADYLTHERPDSWEWLEEDAESLRQTIAAQLGDYDFDESGKDSVQTRLIALVRRAKKLAERDA